MFQLLGLPDIKLGEHGYPVGTIQTFMILVTEQTEY